MKMKLDLLSYPVFCLLTSCLDLFGTLKLTIDWRWVPGVIWRPDVVIIIRTVVATHAVGHELSLEEPSLPWMSATAASSRTEASYFAIFAASL